MREATELERLLAIDPIAEFERMTGKSWKENDDDENLGMMAHHMRRNEEKRGALQAAGDTTFSMTGDEYQANIEAFGFQQIYEESFTAERYGGGSDDRLAVFWFEKFGLLLYFDTFEGRRNSGNVFYNWRFDENAEWGVRSSGRCSEKDPGVWVGYHDCREALRHNMLALARSGELLPQWVEQPSCMWITHWGENDLWGNHFQKPHPASVRTEERISQFPEQVRIAIYHEHNDGRPAR